MQRDEEKPVSDKVASLTRERPGQRYTLAELLAALDYSEPLPPEEREWVDAPSFGAEWPF